MTLRTRLARLMCCPSGTCCSPGACYAEDRSRSQLVDIHKAADAVIVALPALLRERWRNDGPMSRARMVEREDGGNE